MGATAAQVDLSWDPTTKNNDGTTITDLAGYKVYRANGVCPFVGPLQPLKNAAGVHVTTTAAITNASDNNLPLIDGPVAYNVTAYDTASNESARSNCVQQNLNLNPPGAPPNLRGVLVP